MCTTFSGAVRPHRMNVAGDWFLIFQSEWNRCHSAICQILVRLSPGFMPI
jgi:hypothetical protein